MRYRISHQTTYTYSQPVVLMPHLLRLRPRCNGDQQLDAFSVDIEPTPAGTTQVLDGEGNSLLRLWWSDYPTEKLTLQVDSEVTTFCINPFQYLLEPWATDLPIDYPASLITTLKPYLGGGLPTEGGIDPIAWQLGQEIANGVDHNPVMFLSELNQRIYRTCKHQIRETGAPQPPAVTWLQQSGSCRDTTVLFMHACRAVGLASRFVSGYQEGDPDASDRHLHAWAEVFLPGAGWRGYDPTQGLAVSDRHIPLVASTLPALAAPVTGSVRGSGARSKIDYEIKIQVLDEPEDAAAPA